MRPIGWIVPLLAAAALAACDRAAPPKPAAAEEVRKRRRDRCSVAIAAIVAAKEVPPARDQPLRREGGRFAGQITMAPDFDEWPSDIQEALGMTP